MLILLGVLLNASAQIALKHVVAGQRVETVVDVLRLLPAVAVRPAFLIGVVLYVASIANWLVVLSRVELSVAYPAMSLGYVFAFIAGAWWFGETITPSRLAGLACILFGVFLITRSVPTHV